MRFKHFKGRGRFEDPNGSDDPGRPAHREGSKRYRGPKHFERFKSSDDDEPPKVVPLESPRRWGILKDPYKVGLVLQICLTLLLIALLLYCLFPFFAMMIRLDIPIRRVIYIPLAIVVVVIVFTMRAVKLVRRLRKGPP